MADVFISIPFKSDFDDVSEIIKTVASRRGLTAHRADDRRSAESVAEKMRASIQESHVVVADISGRNANVYHEVGLAQAYGKTLIIICRDHPHDPAFNIQHLRFISYKSNQLERLTEELNLAFEETTSPNELLRAMLVPRSLGIPTNDSRFLVAASPLSFRRAVGRTGGYARLRRTASDYVGIRGIMQAFGLLYGFDALPDIVDSEDCRDEVLSEKMSIYCIASPKANRWTRKLLDEYSSRWAPQLEFRAEAKSKNLKNISVSIFEDEHLLHPAGWAFKSDHDRYQRDFGIIVRGPNPFHPQKMIAILAGRSSLGTEAACRAFLDIAKVDEIRKKLRGHNVDLEAHDKPFWALVSMRRALGDGLEEAINDSLLVERVEAFHTTPR